MNPQEQKTASTFCPEAPSCTFGKVMVYGLALAGRLLTGIQRFGSLNVTSPKGLHGWKHRIAVNCAHFP
jgi:hypothetical protein